MFSVFGKRTIASHHASGTKTWYLTFPQCTKPRYNIQAIHTQGVVHITYIRYMNKSTCDSLSNTFSLLQQDRATTVCATSPEVRVEG